MAIVFNPELDLILQREVDVTPEQIWHAWTTPEHLMKWFCPLPWKTVACEIDLKPGGIFRTVMQSPEGQQFPNIGCYLEVIPNKKTELDQCPAARLQASKDAGTFTRP